MVEKRPILKQMRKGAGISLGKKEKQVISL